MNAGNAAPSSWRARLLADPQPPQPSRRARLLATRPQTWARIVVLGAAAALAVAHVLETYFGMKPCALCLWQRTPYWIAIGAAGFALLRAPRGAARNHAVAAMALAAAALAFNVGLGAWHVGVEAGAWAGPASCSGGLPPATLAELRAGLLAPASPPCSQPAARLFGVSLAGWSMATSAALCVCALAAAVRFWRPR